LRAIVDAPPPASRAARVVAQPDAERRVAEPGGDDHRRMVERGDGGAREAGSGIEI
jgi:hypothetical protein